jgi:hypothetical protein
MAKDAATNQTEECDRATTDAAVDSLQFTSTVWNHGIHELG